MRRIRRTEDAEVERQGAADDIASWMWNTRKMNGVPQKTWRLEDVEISGGVP